MPVQQGPDRDLLQGHNALLLSQIANGLLHALSVRYNSTLHGNSHGENLLLHLHQNDQFIYLPPEEQKR